MLAWGVAAGLITLLAIAAFQWRAADQARFRDIIRLKDAELTALKARIKTLEAARNVRLALDRKRDEDEARRAALDAAAAADFLRRSFD